MRLSWFARPRTVLLPTAAGWAVIAAALAIVALALGRVAAPFLAVEEPVGRGLLIVEGWMPQEALRAAAAAFGAGGYEAVVVTGGPILDPECAHEHPTYAEAGAAYLRTVGVDARAVVAVPAPDAWDERTWRSARAVRRWVDARGRRVDAADLFSYGPHTRRSRDLFQLALGPGVTLGTRVAPPVEYDLRHWWRTTVGFRTVVGEGAGLLWVKCCFWPAASDP